MDKKRLAMFTISFGIFIMVVVLLLVRGTARRSGHIQLPDASTSSPDGQSGEEGGAENLTVVEIRPDTVQLAIEVMERPQVYSQRLAVETLWEGGSATQTSNIYVRDHMVRMDTTLSDGSVRHLLRGNEYAYIWYDEDTSYATMTIGDFTADAELRIPTYEDILVLDTSEITDAGYGDSAGTYCISVVTREGTDYETHYWIGTETGLLTACERYYEGERIYQMSASDLTIGQVDDMMFLLPDGVQPS